MRGFKGFGSWLFADGLKRLQRGISIRGRLMRGFGMCKLSHFTSLVIFWIHCSHLFLAYS